MNGPKMTRRQFLQACGVAVAVPAIAKLGWITDAQGAGWRAYDMGDWIRLVIADDAVVDGQEFRKPVVIEGGDNWRLLNTEFQKPTNLQTGTRFEVYRCFFQSETHAFPLTIGHSPRGGTIHFCHLYGLRPGETLP